MKPSHSIAVEGSLKQACQISCYDNFCQEKQLKQFQHQFCFLAKLYVYNRPLESGRERSEESNINQVWMSDGILAFNIDLLVSGMDSASIISCHITTGEK